MGKKKFIGLIKAYRGGEWFEASLESICANTDGAVVVMADTSWIGGEGEEGNCREPLKAFRKRHPEYHITICRSPHGSSSRRQYEIGLAAIVEIFGQDAAVLVVDTDEVWDGPMLAALRDTVEKHPEVHYFRSGLYSYVRSPLYQVWPLEIPHACVALQNALPQDTINRFAVKSGKTMMLPNIRFHHFTYVRKDEQELRQKFATTSSQESVPSDPAWWTRVWPELPRGKKLHMTPGAEGCWGEIKILSDAPFKLPEFCQSIIAEEEQRWKNMLEQDSPMDTIIPTPNAPDASKYVEFAALAPDVTLLRQRLQMLYLEALVLHREASRVSADGSILEIGSGSGSSLAVMALASSAKFWAIDPFCSYDETTFGGTVKGVREGNEENFYDTAKHYGYASRIRHIKLPSDEAIKCLPEPGFGLIFVDGNHTYEIIKNDLELYWPKLKPGGTMIIHDYTTRFPGVIQACQEWSVPYSVFGGTSLAYARKEPGDTQ